MKSSYLEGHRNSVDIVKPCWNTEAIPSNFFTEPSYNNSQHKQTDAEVGVRNSVDDHSFWKLKKKKRLNRCFLWKYFMMWFICFIW